VSKVKLSPSYRAVALSSSSLSISKVSNLAKHYPHLKLAKLALVHLKVVNAFEGTIKQDTQCTYNVAMRRIRVNNVAVVKR